MAKEILIFTDGSSRGNPGPGGFAAIVATDTDVMEIGGREDKTTNNRMELKAAIAGLATARGMREKSAVKLFSDSSYVINGITKWVSGWKQNGWKTKTKTDVLNSDLWMELDELNSSLQVEWKYVAGHAGHDANERCDRIATAFADNEPVQLYKGLRAGYRFSLSAPVGLQKSVRSSNGKSGKAYSYVSMVNGEIRTHQTWDDCKRRVNGQRFARYRKALSSSDEKAIYTEFSKGQAKK